MGKEGERCIGVPPSKAGAKAQRAKWRGDRNQKENSNLGGERRTSGVALRVQEQWWGGRPPRLMFEPRWNK